LTSEESGSQSSSDDDDEEGASDDDKSRRNSNKSGITTFSKNHMKNNTTGGVGLKGGIRLNVNVGASNIVVAERFKKKDMEIQEKNLKEAPSPQLSKKV
jgi:ligand-binding sensor protein